MVANRRDPSPIEDDYQVGGTHGREPVRDEQRDRAGPARELAEGQVAVEEGRLGDRVEAGCGLVEDQQEGLLAHHPPRERKALPLAARELLAV